MSDNPFIEKKKVDRRRNKLRFSTMVYQLSDQDQLFELAKMLTQIANHPSKYKFCLFEKGSTPEGAPFVFTRLAEDPDLKDKELPETMRHRVLALRFGSANFSDMDSILNSQGDKAALGEIRFTYKTGEIGSILFWGEIAPEARSTEGLGVIRKYLGE